MRDRSAFDPLDLEIIDRIYEATWVAVLARNYSDSGATDAARQKNLRQRIFALVQAGGVQFDELYELVMSTYDSPKVMPLIRNVPVSAARRCQQDGR